MCVELTKETSDWHIGVKEMNVLLCRKVIYVSLSIIVYMDYKLLFYIQITFWEINYNYTYNNMQ
jgi:hypothetical protein